MGAHLFDEGGVALELIGIEGSHVAQQLLDLCLIGGVRAEASPHGFEVTQALGEIAFDAADFGGTREIGLVLARVHGAALTDRTITAPAALFTG